MTLPPEPRDAAHIVEDLRALLAIRGFAPPYLLVGHSFGAAYLELFAKAHPKAVMGVVLVDPRHRDFTTARAKAALEGCTVPASIVASLPRVQIDAIVAATIAFVFSSLSARSRRPFRPSMHPDARSVFVEPEKE